MYKLGNCCFCILFLLVHNTIHMYVYVNMLNIHTTYVRIYKIMSDTIRHEIKIRLSSLSFSKPKTWYWIIAIVTNWYDIKVCCACACASASETERHSKENSWKPSNATYSPPSLISHSIFDSSAIWRQFINKICFYYVVRLCVCVFAFTSKRYTRGYMVIQIHINNFSYVWMYVYYIISIIIIIIYYLLLCK